MRSTITAAIVAALVSAVSAGAATTIIVSSKNIRDGSVQTRDLSASTRKALSAPDAATAARLSALEHKAGIPGPKGDTGDTGAAGATGATGAPGNDSTFKVASLSSDLGVKAPAWAARVGSCDSTAGAPIGAADVTDHLRLTLPNDGGAGYATGMFNGLYDVHLRDIERIVYSERAEGGVDGFNAPFFRIYTNGYADRIVYTPATQAGGPGSSKGWRRHVVTDGTVRYDDDAGAHPEMSWADLIAAHGDDEVSTVRIVAGCSIEMGASADFTGGPTGYADNVVLSANGETARYDFGG